MLFLNLDYKIYTTILKNLRIESKKRILLRTLSTIC